METLEQLKVIYSDQPKDGTAKEFTSRFGRAKYYKFSKHGCWYYFEGNNWIPIERPQLATRSLSDIKLIIELMEANKTAKKSALLSLKEAIEPDGLINSEAGLKTIRTIQNAIDKIVSHL